MAAHSPALTGRKASARSRVSNGKTLLDGVDARSAVARRYRDVAAQLVSDQGGIDRCSETRVQLLRRFAACAVLAEETEASLLNGEPINVTEYALLVSTMVRVATRVGLGRRAKDVMPTLAKYLDTKAEIEQPEDDG